MGRINRAMRRKAHKEIFKSKADLSELHDVLAVASLLGIIEYDDDENPKWKRWAERLGKHD